MSDTLFTATCSYNVCYWRTTHATATDAEFALMAHSLRHAYIGVGLRGTIVPSTTLSGWTPHDDQRFQEMLNG